MMTAAPLLLALAALSISTVAAMPSSTTEIGCASGCDVDGVCHPAGEWWPDASKPGCQRFHCLESTRPDNTTVYLLAAVTCPVYALPTDGTQYVETPGVVGAPYPDCCPNISVLSTPSTTTTAISSAGEPALSSALPQKRSV